ncbi:MAG: hypothetical protein ABIY70_22805 [Capsulimonas sp.]|uniref:hypothetical protein n=1 Tax=Capsulimonas sp. TaxID=2494211 RepID=UPI003263ADD9
MMESRVCARKRIRQAGQTIFELGCLLFVIAAGIAVAVSFWRHWGIIGALIGFPVGFFGLYYLYVGILKLDSWWLSVTPPCCCGEGSSSSYDVEFLKEGLFPGGSLEFVYTCQQCGRRYVKGHRKFLEVYTDNTLHPYMKHAPFGRWRLDGD